MHQMQIVHRLDVVVPYGHVVLKLLAIENKALLVHWNALVVLNLCLHQIHRV